MKAINENSTKILRTLLQGIENLDDSRVIQSSDGMFYPVQVLFKSIIPEGNVYLVANYEMSGKKMIMDPGIYFLEHDNSYKPFVIRNDNFGYMRQATNDDVLFAEQWLENIKEQQEL